MIISFCSTTSPISRPRFFLLFPFTVVSTMGPGMRHGVRFSSKFLYRTFLHRTAHNTTSRSCEYRWILLTGGKLLLEFVISIPLKPPWNARRLPYLFFQYFTRGIIESFQSSCTPHLMVQVPESTSCCKFCFLENF